MLLCPLLFTFIMYLGVLSISFYRGPSFLFIVTQYSIMGMNHNIASLLVDMEFFGSVAITYKTVI